MMHDQVDESVLRRVAVLRIEDGVRLRACCSCAACEVPARQSLQLRTQRSLHPPVRLHAAPVCSPERWSRHSSAVYCDLPPDSFDAQSPCNVKYSTAPQGVGQDCADVYNTPTEQRVDGRSLARHTGPAFRPRQCRMCTAVHIHACREFFKCSIRRLLSVKSGTQSQYCFSQLINANCH